MRNILIGLTFLLTLGLSVVSEPIDDVIDTLAGGTNPTYELSIDSFAGVSRERDDDDDDEHEEDEHEEKTTMMMTMNMKTNMKMKRMMINDYSFFSTLNTDHFHLVS